jgi:hypothetical protein
MYARHLLFKNSLFVAIYRCPCACNNACTGACNSGILVYWCTGLVPVLDVAPSRYITYLNMSR